MATHSSILALENPTDRGAWQATVHRVTQSWTQLKQLNTAHKLKEYLFQFDVIFRDSSVGKESSCNAGDPGSIPGLGRSAGETLDDQLQYSGLENSMDFIVHRLQRVGYD